MLRVIEGAVADGREHLAKDEQWVAVQIVRRRASHDHRTREVEAGEDDFGGLVFDVMVSWVLCVARTRCRMGQ